MERMEGGYRHVEYDYEAALEYYGSNFLWDCYWWILGEFCLFHSWNARNEVHLVRLPGLRAFGDLPADVKDNEEWDVDVYTRCQIISSLNRGTREKTHRQ